MKYSNRRSWRTFAALGMSLALVVAGAQAEVTLRSVVTGEILTLEEAREEDRDTPAVQEFLQTGKNPYNSKPACLKKGEDFYLTACSACHGHHAEGKIGPSLSDDYWTYPEGLTDEGLFAIIFGGARASMGPQYMALTLDEMLLVMAWVRHLYHGPVSAADWMTPEEKADYVPYEIGQKLEVDDGDTCAP